MPPSLANPGLHPIRPNLGADRQQHVPTMRGTKHRREGSAPHDRPGAAILPVELRD
jgi:hypothetical protein